MACIEYETALLGTREGAAPPWFDAAISRALAPIHEDIKTLKGDVKTVKTDIQSLKGDVKTIQADLKTLTSLQNKTLRIAAVTFNGLQPTGENVNLEAVPNVHGTDIPTGLPALSSRKAIRELSSQQQNEWLQYYHPHQRNIATRPQEQRIAELISIVGAKDPGL